MKTTALQEPVGVLLVDKPGGITSHDVISRLRRKLNMKRIGHAGTLDPMATGLLIILIGRATKLSQYLISLDKEYEGTIELGKVTDSHDADGEVLETREVPALSAEQAAEAMQSFVGDQYQTPPMFSAVKIGGVPLYKMARKGKEVEREPRFIRISSFDLVSFESPRLAFKMRCSKGTYVRTLANDLGQKLSCGAFLSSLRRTATDRFRIEQTLPLETLEEMPVGDIVRRLLPAHEAVPSFVL